MSGGGILLVDDDPQIQRLLRSQLTLHAYDVRVAGRGSDALLLLEEVEPDLVLLDLHLPGMSSLDVCRQLREWSAVPLILLTVADNPETRVDALDLGADDCLTKPFDMGELLARIRAVLRRSHGSGEKPPDLLELGDLRIDLARHYVRRGDTDLPLTRTEFGLLREFATYADRVLTYSHLLEAVWGSACADLHLVHVHVGNLRRKLNPNPTGARPILSIPGVGYRLRL